MYSYVVNELPRLIRTHFGMYGCDASRLSITGHSMGGHGALVCAIRNPRLFRSVSAFAPICNPSAAACAWGKKAFTGYLQGGAEEAADPAKGYDASVLLAAAGGPLFDDILVDIGWADAFLKDGQLQPEALQVAALAASQPLTLRMQAGYDHSYYFVSTFLPEHIAFHAARLIIR
jgi:S-formylglutathione hydrolase